MLSSRAMHRVPHPLRLAGGLLVSLCVAVATLSAENSSVEPRWISILEDGVYRISHEELSVAAPLGAVPSHLLGLTGDGTATPLWIDDGGDGLFDSGDTFEFIGDHLEGEAGFYSEYSHHNIYRLSFDGSNALRMKPGDTATRTDVSQPVARLTVRSHFEQESVMVRFNQRNSISAEETWFWQRLSFLDDEPFETALELPGLAPGPAHLRAQMRGWSRHRMAPESRIRQHMIDIRVDGTPVIQGEWDGQELFQLEGDVPSGILEASGGSMTVSVPARLVDDEPDPIVDLSLLNWIEIDYPHSGSISEPQTQLVVEGTESRTAHLSAPSAASLVAYDRLGRRWSRSSEPGEPIDLSPIVEHPEAELFLVRDEGFLSLSGTAVDRPSDWRRTDRQADYLMIAHSSLLKGTERLADFHRSRGLGVAVVDVQDLYDEFNHGVVHPSAIRDFVFHAFSQWAQPAPKFVLLVGDASWDITPEDSEDSDYADWSYQAREADREGFLKNASTPYAEGVGNRALIPTGSYRNAEGHAASDNYFVAFDEDEFTPSLALGRLPIVSPEDLDAIVDKTIRYVQEAGVGPWRRNLLWISNEEQYIQTRTDLLAAEQVARGFTSAKVYPQRSEKSNAAHQDRLLDAFADGQLVVYFHGHGGRYIWRTGPTDYKKNRDLFNLDHLDQLQPSARLPVILSMTCFSAPFDHPLADSIGEKFLRLPNRGAIAVFAASWRNSPAQSMSQALVDQLTKPQTIGEAILAAKQISSRRDLIESYNLLGDPAVPIAAPSRRLELELDTSRTDGLQLAVRFPDLEGDFDGQAIVEWQGIDGDTIASEEISVTGNHLEALLSDRSDTAKAVSVYMWDAKRGIDGIGALQWGEPEGTEAETIAGSASR